MLASIKVQILIIKKSIPFNKRDHKPRNKQNMQLPEQRILPEQNLTDGLDMYDLMIWY